MAVTSIMRDFNDSPNIVRMEASNTLAQIATAGYLADEAANIAALNSGEWEWLPSDSVLIYGSDGIGFFKLSSDLDSLETFSSVGNGAVTLPVVNNNFTVFDSTLGALKDLGFSASDVSKTKVVMAGSATLVGYIAHFVDVSGTVDDTAGPVINAGNIQAGLSGTAGTHISYPATAANGSLILAAANAGGAFNTTISNGAMGQSSVYTIADIEAATGGIVVSSGAVRMKAVAAAAAAGGAAAQSFTDAFCTTGSVVIGNWVTQANAGQVVKIVPGAGSFVVTSTVNIGVGTFSYIITK
jgi:hypothetical protein